MMIMFFILIVCTAVMSSAILKARVDSDCLSMFFYHSSAIKNVLKMIPKLYQSPCVVIVIAVLIEL